MDSNAYVTRERIDADGSGALADREVAVKDNISTAGVRTTAGSTMLAEYVPPYSATVVERLRAAGAAIVGKTNMDEFGMGTTTETSAFGAVENPVAEGHVPGGSSGGSAAAVADGDVPIALGSDTGGSVRCPAAFTGTVGIKPTYGLVSRYGLIAYANSLEQIGPIAESVEDAALALDVIAGPDDRDATTRDASDHYDTATGADPAGPAPAYGFADAADGSVANLTIGVVTDLLDGADAGVVGTFEDAIDCLSDAGATIREVELPSLEHAVAAYYVIAMSEASSNLARFDGVRFGHDAGKSGNWNESFGATRAEGFGEEVIRRILLGTYALSAGYHDKYYKQAQEARAWIKQDFDAVFDEVDVLASPTMPVPPMERGESLDDPLTMYLADANTTPVNLANLPAISVPAGETDGLPVGAQFVGPAFGEPTIVRVASALEDRV
ncbi:Asp-tRNA(Asn)/Glu-tRNA(Gln) amidotransferase subunit GatA [Halococcoides cellulosivorans]|uniref:Glutamyl-tRNA(Gln) amidotransferase subunit A n=1 Tax=Halococcoides cellulosivorans TaxID=1679096 RepID=A0A2R4X2N8_9EURY|nr:Asp-tRNA(Asn)/Glu-tRNA(Gln) amidotransferase subunit GatA [Halococcoides cellulosivorans]AWB28067.1 Asp-tRNA(Asn)/Glu-tRNA(Gln) amidotransferase GatCAB subunit A [Halococcoides cellulosivorans]